MTIFIRAALTIALALILAPRGNAQEGARRLAGDAVRVTAARDKVHVAIGSDLFETRIEVATADGEIVFESGILSARSFDWEMRNSLGEQVAAGDYVLTITYRTPAGKLMRRAEQVSVQGDGATAQESAAPPPEPSAVGTITGEGTAGKIAKFNGPNSITDSTVLTESAGKIRLVGALEIGATAGSGVSPTIVNPNNIPNFALVRFYPATGANVNTSFTVVPRGTGQPNNRAQFSITNTDAIADPSNVEFAALRARGADFVFGTGKSGTGTIRPLMFSAGYMTDNVTNANQLVLATNGGVGIGTATPDAGIKLEINGNMRITPSGGNGGYMQFGTPNGETGFGWIKPAEGAVVASRADIRFNGGRLMLAVGLTSNVPSNSGIVLDTFGRVGIGTETPTNGKLHADGGIGTAVYGRGDDIGVYGQGPGRGVKGEGDYGVYGDGVTIGVYGKSTGGTGVAGESGSIGAAGIYGGNTAGGLAGFFAGNVDVEGTVTVINGNVCADNIPCASDARLKQNVTNLNYGLNHLMRLRPVSWRWKNEPEGKPQMGLVAQEVERVLPELVMREADAAKPLGLNYMALLPVAVKAIQEQQELIEQLQARVALLERAAKKRPQGRRPRPRR
ncbi:MAG TPA: tail fiber domain-containing protein [Pyrinomonadaceae bacterium]|nr:tail fiber domain-containing protein [Pyrinomonadaceae bacterium]